VLVITHPHDDHVGGLSAVVAEMPVRLALDPMIESESDAYAALRKALQDRGVAVKRVSEGARINLGRGIYADVLNPPEPLLLGGDSDENDNSVVLRLVDGEVSVLLTADIEEVGAARLAGYGEAIHSTILKVPHHGSAGAALPEFLDAVGPELAVISVGENNPFGHPSREMLRELERVGAKVMRTDRDGAVTVTVRPPRWWEARTAERRATADYADSTDAGRVLAPRKLGTATARK
jgi:competence protein ComEC